jgi:hypothetical protein
VNVRSVRFRLVTLYAGLSVVVCAGFKYTPAGGRVWLEIRGDDGQGIVEVGDTEPGILAAAVVSRTSRRSKRVRTVGW